MRRIAAAFSLLALAGCAPAYLPVDATGAKTATSPASVDRGRTRRDPCGAAALAYLVGKPRTEIPVATDPSRRQVVCTQCPLDSAVRPRRQTVTYDASTNLVTGVVCR